MADKDQKHPLMSQMQQPDGSLYVYVQVNFHAEQGQYIELNPLGKAVKFKGGLRFPRGIVLETVPEDWYTWVMAREGEATTKPKSNIVVPE